MQIEGVQIREKMLCFLVNLSAGAEKAKIDVDSFFTVTAWPCTNIGGRPQRSMKYSALIDSSLENDVTGWCKDALIDMIPDLAWEIVEFGLDV
jgi:hypothetical protein